MKLRKNAKPLPPLYQLTINGDWVEVCPFCSRPVSGGGCAACGQRIINAGTEGCRYAKAMS